MRYYQNKGFTLTELLVGMGILAIIVAIAYPSYQRYINNARLEKAKSAMMDNIRALEKHYFQHYSYKRNSTNWMDLPITETEHFCIRMQGNPRSATKDKFTMKAVAFNKNNEPRVLVINQDMRMMLCNVSSSSCDKEPQWFSAPGRVDKECQVL